MTDQNTNEPVVEDLVVEETPIVVVLSDARGKTAADVVEAAQFEEGLVIIRKIGNVRSADMVREYLDKHDDGWARLAVFHTIVDNNLRHEIRNELDSRGIPSIDLLGPSMRIISTLTGAEPISQAGRRTKVQIEEI